MSAALDTRAAEAGGPRGGAAEEGRAARSTQAGAIAWARASLTGWGRIRRAECLAARPERLSELRAAVAAPPGGSSLLAYGAGRSYGDACLNHGGAAVMTARLDRMLAFDPATGVLECEPGVTFADLLRIFLPRGFLAPATPGTGFATLGGAVANDVHGKNHHRDGSFGDHLEWVDLLLPDGRMLRASAAENAELFRATIGGLGLTGIVAGLGLRLARVPTDALRVRRRRVRDLEEMLAGFAAAEGARFSVAWIDALARGASLGRGVLETAEPSATPLGAATTAPRRPRRVPLDLPGWALNPLTVRGFNALYWRRVPPGDGTESVEGYGRFLYPLDALGDWNRLYGRGGFHQFQCVVPFEDGAATLRRLLGAVSGFAGGASPLAVLKAMGRPGRGLLSFARPGWTLAVDVPARPGSAALFATLERIVRDAGGRVYLAKDALLSREGFDAMYPGAARFRQIRAAVDPDGRLASDLARRLGL
jgi:decaprenylphospho-beta-D-ribofuranose 2-oxidase